MSFADVNDAGGYLHTEMDVKMISPDEYEAAVRGRSLVLSVKRLRDNLEPQWESDFLIQTLRDLPGEAPL
ncbi:hypothetical protein Bpfe_011281 [Biomphalaria pfeifferi]|uniref:Uncharacterized protein n=1 Tax=Biomphalaria pfeifferi TaxID=112525 RepID=A0AAD8BSV5_BIOPF|nr:hypothetical protein Bpfe_011281 [Biomphalaria pfeifferi]